MIRVERHEEVSPGIYRYAVPQFGLEGRSPQPLLDACLQIIERMPGCAGETAAIFREGHTEWDLRCSVAWGAAHMVENCRFAKRRSDVSSSRAEAAE